MAVKFRDYYEVLGVPRTATQDEIQRAFRDLARKTHPDVDKRPDANKRFAEINEAYEVLKDPEKRKRYDQLGSSYKQGQQFTPPPGWEDVEVHFGNAGGGGFSDFFQSIFGGDHSGIFGRGPTADARTAGRGQRSRRTTRTWRMPDPEEAGEETSSDVEIRLDVTPWDAALGAEAQLRTFERPVVVKLPPGTQSGQKLRLRGMGLPRPDGTRGDAYVVIRIVVPKTLTPREKELFESLRRESKFKPE
jgi:curved DNA-binding protein